ncbi:MAG: FAD-binding oxidoreductase [Proteobacteria bacterium]|nr:FAD-binding oxidoreductase [Pseudomonadota bacterium]MBU1387449.1 FAD-binding oxidoreductase [Pseudomonadota bacterium]MBU1541964.1 FAD-binding oxidoreductase [Pseudomonadota bacterium]MBU2431257.1 FAD-binding oxidoreductase [Pseudomonadota bacterium]MBU2479569.1 FAD-binding oxidoreductase [Pseudomonadota bacterium]
MSSILNKLIAVVGEDYASNRQEELFTYSKDLGTAPPQWPEYVVAPKTDKEIQKIVLLANEEKVPIVPLGGGMTLAGLALPLKGGIIIDLKRLDKIIEVNPESRYMVVEAGISNGKVTAHLHNHYPRLMHSEPGAPPAATIGGNLAIHGQGDLAHPYGFNSDMVNGMEVILPTGEMIQLGSCAVGSGWYSMQPLPDLKFFSGWNGTTGIITKVSLKLFPNKKFRDNDLFVVENEELVPEILYELTHLGMTEDLISSSAAIPPLMNKLHHISINIAGDYEEEIEFKRHMVFDVALSKFIRSGTGGIGNLAGEWPRPQVSKSSDWKKGGGFEYVGAIIPVSLYPECYRQGARISEQHDIPYTILGRVIGCSHAMMFSWSYAFNRADEETVKHARQALHETDDLVMNLNGTIWKPAVYGQRLMMDRMNKNTLELMGKIKTLLDPNGIMNPGNWEVNR